MAARGRSICSAPRARSSSSRASWRCTRSARGRRLQGARGRAGVARLEQSMSACPCAPSSHAALHRAAPALLRSLAGEGARKGRHRPPVHLRVASSRCSPSDATPARAAALLPHAARRKVEKVMVKKFPVIFNVGFTAQMEGELDKIEDGRWAGAVLEEFWSPFQDLARSTTTTSRRSSREAHDLSALETEKCPECGGKLVPKGGFFGPFVACENHPKVCKYTRPSRGEEAGRSSPSTSVRVRREAMVVRHGALGRLPRLLQVPQVPGTRSMPTGVLCPKDGGDIAERAPRSAARRSTAARTIPTATSWCGTSRWEKCPECGYVGAEAKATRRAGTSASASSAPTSGTSRCPRDRGGGGGGRR
jgi:DNA topoisomerase I